MSFPDIGVLNNRPPLSLGLALVTSFFDLQDVAVVLCRTNIVSILLFRICSLATLLICNAAILFPCGSHNCFHPCAISDYTGLPAANATLCMQVHILQKQVNEANDIMHHLELAKSNDSLLQLQLNNAKLMLQRQEELTAAVEASYYQCKAGNTWVV